MVKAQITFVALLLVGTACKPDVEGRSSSIETDRVLAIRSFPAEAREGDAVSYEALLAGPDGAVDPAGLEWALCTQTKPLDLTGPIAPTCLEPRSRYLRALTSDGAVATGRIPLDACRKFGPSPPEPEEGQPQARAVDPDTTGGYYQPIRVLVPTDDEPDYAVGVTRLDCGLGGATQEQAFDYQQRYRPNDNPMLEALSLRRPGGKEQPLSTDAALPPLTVPRGETVTLEARWADCPAEATCGDGICGAGEVALDGGCPEDCLVPAGCSTAPMDAMTPLCQRPPGCSGSEPYPVLDLVERRLVDRRESIRVSWFATGGSFDHDRTGRTQEEAGTPDSDNEWTAPDAAGDVFVWVVLRDDRGGLGFEAQPYRIHVGP